jgi:hypothetical protein
MQKVLGGENIYVGKAPPISHTHMFIPNELFDIRKQLLCDAFKETNANSTLVEKWLQIDESFRKIIVKQSPSECEPRFNNDPILDFPNPEK